MQNRAADDLKRLTADALKSAGLQFARADSYVTPRRLALVIDGLPEKQPDVTEEKKGPRVGSPDQAIKGFLKGAGLSSLDKCEKREVGKAEFWFAVVYKKGRVTAEVLAEILPDVVAKLPWPKSMRWANETVRWVRPLHSMLCVFNGAVVDFAFGPVKTGNTTRGHRFLASGAITAKDFAEYKAKLKSAYVMLDAGERAEAIWADATMQAKDLGLTVREDRGLLEEVAGLVEWPVPLIGSIDAAFMDLPPEVMTTTMRANQKYFALLNADGSMASKFVIVANTLTEDGGKAVVAGNERVLRARLSDARFFWDQDRKVPLAERVPALKDIVFHAKLGTIGEKVERIAALAVRLCQFIPGADRDRVRSAAELCKADLVTGMVGEFPELQGIMGRYYALYAKEAPEVADAIAEHYAPKGPNDKCPTAPVSVAVALADKIDTLVGFFAVGEKPTGSGDPFALRRAALGVIRLVLENKLRLSFGHGFSEAAKLYGATAAKFNGAELLSFFADRLKVTLREKGVRHDLIDAVFSLGGEDDLVRLVARVEALGSFLTSDDGANLLVAYRRAANIVGIEEKKDKATYAGAVDEAQLSAVEEKTLHRVLIAVNAGLESALKKEDFAGAMSLLATLRKPGDAFFDKVIVNADDKDVRINRLRLLASIRDTMNKVADFSKVEG
jgi:glycyl-tRNA synthetase beta chain